MTEVNWKQHAEALAGAVKQAYLILLMGRGSYRFTEDYQHALCVLRDEIAKHEDRTPEDVQDDYEAQALTRWKEDSK